MKLEDLLIGTEYELILGNVETEVREIFYESKLVKPQTAFVCIKGSHYDGHDYINEAAGNGAAVVVIQKGFDISALRRTLEEKNITVISVGASEECLSVMAALFYGEPAKKLLTIAVTGTKGKTTTSFMIKGILESAGVKTGVIGTIGIFTGSRMEKCDNTTPNGLVINRALSQMVSEGCRAAVIEVSSQALKHHRTDGIIFDYGIFTNLTLDHIGEFEHESFEEYRECKKRLFKISKKGVVNIDDKNSLYMMKYKECKYITYGYREEADLRCVNSSFGLEDNRPVTDFELEGLFSLKARSFLPGKFNVYNAMAAMAVCHDAGIDEIYFKDIENLVIPGRVQSVVSDDNLQVIVDYAHNEASLESLLTACLEHKPERLVCVFGCGGNRSRDRRIGMGRVSGKYADFTIITEDNSRNEPLESILTDIKTGLAMTDGFYVEMPDRRSAIRFSILRSKPGDLVVIAGKGHEEYQEIDGRRLPFSDTETALEAYRELKGD